MLNAPSAGNGNLRCYNMFPAHFKNIDEMTKYLSRLHQYRINAVWINPVHLSGEFVLNKTDMLTGQSQQLKGSLYAMADATLIDPRFSVVARDEEGDMTPTRKQIRKLGNYDPKIIEQCKDLRLKLRRLKINISQKEQEVARNTSSNKRKNSSEVAKTITSLSSQLTTLETKKHSLEENYNHVMAQQQTWIRLLDSRAMKAFTTRAKQLGITPMFDVVLNHLAVDAPFIEQNKELFNFDDKTYPDTTAFSYSKLLGTLRGAPYPVAEQELALQQIPQIINVYWRPFIDLYVKQWGFSAARIDCVGKIPQQLRSAVYDLIRQGVAEQENPGPVIILEEALFSNMTPQEFVSKVKNAGATHITGSSYYAEREWHGGLRGNYNQEDYYKQTMAQHGVVNFTGNHDHYSCAMTVCRQLAFERLRDNQSLYDSYQAFIQEKETANYAPLSEAALEVIKSTFIHFYVQQIIAELHDPDHYNDTINRFGIAFRDRFLTNVYAGSGGYFMLSGDEFASFDQPSVFIRANGEPVYPNKQLGIFTSPLKNIAARVVHDMAVQAVTNKKFNTVFTRLTAADQEIFLSSFIANIYNELNAGIEKTTDRFWDAIESKADAISPAMRDYYDIPCSFENRWNAPQSLQAFASVGFLAETNNIMSRLPPSKIGFWSEIFKAVNNEILIAVRLNGPGYDARPDVIIQNMNPHKPIHFSRQDLEKIALWLQKRGFPQEDASSVAQQSADYHKAYGCIMGSTTYQQRPANLYFAGRLELDSDIEEYHVDIDGTQHTFDIVVEPLPEQQEPLLSPALPKVIPETYSNEILKSIFGSAMTGQSPTLELLDSPQTEQNDVSKDLLLRFSAMKLQCAMLPEVPKSTSTPVATSSASHSESESSDFFDSSFDDENKSWSDCSSEGGEDRGMATFDEDSDEDELLRDIRKLSGQRSAFFK
ncbi:alpha-amylase family protein [Candidatus Berkiella aquae]|uniref:Uncharacterized protein n=1 Tax=Candidatus Berkiella aquae TaxID=295108 RepID=A0A0Q9YN40_9GAMM|nr:alpha-amylase family protein [Candidatus Berkiella aquae]MCS5709962.1 hypothetical protein [Candidatus Berkiella aquae]